MRAFDAAWCADAANIPPGLQQYLSKKQPAGTTLLYACVHKASRKVYIGKTRVAWIDRHRQHFSNKGYFGNALRKHGGDAFEYYVLELVPDDAAGDREAALIAEHATLAPNGYNLHSGGTGGNTHPDTRARQSATHKAIAKATPLHVRKERGQRIQKAKEKNGTHTIGLEMAHKAWVELPSDGTVRTEWRAKLKAAKRIRTPEEVEAAKLKRRATLDAKRAANIPLWWAEALPFEPDPSKRVDKQFYIKDGKLHRWHRCNRPEGHWRVVEGA